MWTAKAAGDAAHGVRVVNFPLFPFVSWERDMKKESKDSVGSDRHSFVATYSLTQRTWETKATLELKLLEYSLGLVPMKMSSISLLISKMCVLSSSAFCIGSWNTGSFLQDY